MQKLFVTILFIFSLSTFALSNEAALADDFKLFTTKEGLSSNVITCVIQDTYGYIWIGTENGLNKFDGYSVTSYMADGTKPNSISGNHIHKLFVDSKGVLWVGTLYNGLNKYRFDTDDFESYGKEPNNIFSLSHNSITDIVEDIYGNIWISSFFGLNKYRPETNDFDVFHTDIQVNINEEIVGWWSKCGFSDEKISKLKTLNGKVFENVIGIRQAIIDILSYQITDEEFKQIYCWNFGYFKEESKGDETIFDLDSDSKGNLWIASPNSGLIKMDVTSKQSINYSETGKNRDSIKYTDVASVMIKDSLLFVGGVTGWVEKFNLNTENASNVYKPNNLYVNDFFISEDDKLVIIAGELIIGYNLTSKEITWHEDVVRNQFNSRISTLNEKLKGIHFRHIFIDRQGNYWLSTDSGVILLEKHKQFQLHIPNTTENSLSGGIVTSIETGVNGSLILGYYNGSLDIFSADWKKEESYTSLKDNRSTSSILALQSNSDSSFYIGTFFGGLQKYSFKNKLISEIPLHPQDVNHADLHDVRDVAFDKEGNLWVVIHGGGLSKLINDTVVERYRANYQEWQDNLHHDWLNSICVDSKNNIWVGSFEGVSMFNPQSRQFNSFKKGEENSGLSNSSINHMTEDSEGNLWFATNSGLNLFSYEDSTFSVISDYAPFKVGSIYAIVEDDDKNIWMSASTGLIKYTKADTTFSWYGPQDGIRTVQFKPRSAIKKPDGSLLFGGVNGLIEFYPNDIKANQKKPEVIISGFKLFYENVEIQPDNPNAIFQQHPSITEQIILDYDQNIFTIEFIALNYIQTEKNQFKYRLEGFDKDWHSVGNKREATYTNLSPGKYTFRVKASNNDGIWNEEGAELYITVLSPWWMTWWFRALLIILVFSVFISFTKYRMRRIQKLNKKLDLMVKKRTLELELKNKQVESQNDLLVEKNEEIIMQAQELEKSNIELLNANKTKNKFFSIIAHDLKGPMGNIMGISELLEKKIDSYPKEKIGKYAHMIHFSTDRLYKLLLNLLDWSRTQAGHIKMSPESFSSDKLIKDIIVLLKPLADNKNIMMMYEGKDATVYADYNMINTVVRNIVSNSIKFTPNYGVIYITASVSQKMCLIAIRDTGVGMDKDTLNGLFKIDQNISRKGTNDERGTGLGLIICKEFIEKNNGSISVSSELEKGSEFIISIPLHIKE